MLRLKYYGVVSVHQIPMIMTFNDRDAELIVASLGKSLDEAYKMIDFFQIDEDFDPWTED